MFRFVRSYLLCVLRMQLNYCAKQLEQHYWKELASPSRYHTILFYTHAKLLNTLYQIERFISLQCCTESQDNLSTVPVYRYHVAKFPISRHFEVSPMLEDLDLQSEAQ